jgi:lysophospholipid acyltransferase (LPLAT)-like uncharacterized protein
MALDQPDRTITKWYDPLLSRVVFPLFALSVKMLMRSYRIVRVEGIHGLEEALSRSEGRAIYASWHQRVVAPVPHLTRRNVTVMVSRSRDGQYAAWLLHAFGLRVVRGSSTRGGADALRELTQKIREGRSGGMVVDGPLGPPREAKIGAVLLAYKAGVPIIPISYGADRCWVLNSWDRFMIPKPFARVILRYEEPIWIPVSAEGEDLEPYRRLLEDRLNEGNGWGDRQFGGERPWRKP